MNQWQRGMVQRLPVPTVWDKECMCTSQLSQGFKKKIPGHEKYLDLLLSWRWCLQKTLFWLSGPGTGVISRCLHRPYSSYYHLLRSSLRRASVLIWLLDFLLFIVSSPFFYNPDLQPLGPFHQPFSLYAAPLALFSSSPFHIILRTVFHPLLLLPFFLPSILSLSRGLCPHSHFALIQRRQKNVPVSLLPVCVFGALICTVWGSISQIRGTPFLKCGTCSFSIVSPYFVLLQYRSPPIRLCPAKRFWIAPFLSLASNVNVNSKAFAWPTSLPPTISQRFFWRRFQVEFCYVAKSHVRSSWGPGADGNERSLSLQDELW